MLDKDAEYFEEKFNKLEYLLMKILANTRVIERDMEKSDVAKAVEKYVREDKK